MAIQPISQINGLLESNLTNKTNKTNKTETPFSAFLGSAVANIEEVNGLQKTADQMSVDFAVGKIDNIADVMIAQEKASIALQYTVQLRDKLLDAYNSIMQIQV